MFPLMSANLYAVEQQTTESETSSLEAVESSDEGAEGGISYLDSDLSQVGGLNEALTSESASSDLVRDLEHRLAELEKKLEKQSENEKKGLRLRRRNLSRVHLEEFTSIRLRSIRRKRIGQRLEKPGTESISVARVSVSKGKVSTRFFTDSTSISSRLTNRPAPDR